MVFVDLSEIIVASYVGCRASLEVANVIIRWLEMSILTAFSTFFVIFKENMSISVNIGNTLQPKLSEGYFPWCLHTCFADSH